MGQGYSLTTLSAGSAGIDVPELVDLSYEKSLGDARFMKAIRARHRDGLVVAKVVMKPYASMEFGKYIADIIRERKLLADIPNALGYHRAFETSSNGFLVRQYVYSSIYDRLSTRPFLEDIEKKWLAFQLLYAIRDCHARDLYHGDIKTENTLVTSWNWLYLSDFSSSYKPTFLPEDNPADFSFYFDISARRTCYLAPERFLGPGEKQEGRRINWAMDIFSVGCVIAELFLETPIFNLSQLFKYRKGEYDPEQLHLSRIEDKDIRELVSHMIQLEPESRYSADEYLNFWRHKAFPEYFYSFLHQYMYLITDPSSGRSPVTAGSSNLGESDDRIDRVYYDFDKISYFLGYEDEKGADMESQLGAPLTRLFPMHLDIPNKRQVVSVKESPMIDDGTLLFLGIVTSALRSTARSSSRIRACELLLAFSKKLTDDAKLDRVLPYIISLLNDPADIIKVAALRTLTQIIALVSTSSPINAYLFPEYVLPRLESFAPLSGRHPSSLVRATYASCLATLAESASHFLDVCQAFKSEGSLPTADLEVEGGTFVHAYQNLYDVARADLVRVFESQTKSLLTDSNPDVRRAFLGSVSSLCVFFGSAKANDVILSHLNTYLNDRDWRLKCAFFETIVGVATYVGSTNLEEFILPLMLQALTDPEETVVEKVLRSLATMAHLGLFQRSRTWGLIDLVDRFTMHPNTWIREAAVHFISSAVKYASVADYQCIVKPLLQPYFRITPSSFSEISLLDSLKKPLPRPVLDLAIAWADKSIDSIFWKSVKQSLSVDLLDDRLPLTPSIDLAANALTKAQKNTEDHKWIGRLRNLGMSTEDEVKFMALRRYIWRVAKRQTREEAETNTSLFNAKIVLKDVGVDLQTVFFDRRQPPFEGALSSNGLGGGDEGQPQTIADALLDASSTMEAPVWRPESSASSSSGIKRVDTPTLTKPFAIASNSPRISSPLSSSPRIHSEDHAMLSCEREQSRPSSQLGRQTHERSTPKDSSLLNARDNAALSQHNHSVSRKGSAIDLMQRKTAMGKAIAETSTSPANAIGQVNGPYSRDPAQKPSLALAREDKLSNPTQLRYQAAHTYSGRDPSVLQLLDSVYLENYPMDVVEFGPLVTPVNKRQPALKADGAGDAIPRLNGSLVAMFGEHTGSVNRVVVSPDHLFFVTGSDDGSVRIWDCARLERNIAHRSRQVHKHASGVKVTSICFVENTHCFISTASDGSVHIVKVDCVNAGQGTTKYGKPRLMRQWYLPDPSSYVVWAEHFKADNQSILIVATNTSQIIAIDIKLMVILYTLENPLHHGTPTCFCLDAEKHWLLLGTSHGVLNLWDLRFRIRLRAWGFPAASPIHRISLHPQYDLAPAPKQKDSTELPPKLICIAGGTGANEVTIYDLNKMTCEAVFHATSTPLAATSSADPDPASSKPYTLQNLEGVSSTRMLNRFATALSLEPNLPDRGARTLAAGPATGSSFLVSSGPDRKVRFWNLADVAASRIVSGLDADEGNPDYATLAAPAVPQITMERAITREEERERERRARATAAGVALPPREPGEAVQKPSRTSVVSEQQARLLRSHLDAVTDVAVIEWPYRMVVSVDRSGMVMVFL